LITTPEEAETHLITCVYDARTLVDDTSDKSFDALIDTIVSCIATETWGDNGGGEAEIRILKPGLLVVSQTQAVHSDIRGLLMEIREMRQTRPTPGEAAAQAPQHEPLVTRSFRLQIKRNDNTDDISNELRELIEKSLPDHRWTGQLDDGQAVVLTVLPDRIVVRHKESVQDEVEALLKDSNVAERETRAAAGGGNHGGGFFRTDHAEKPLREPEPVADNPFE
jgi:hypothetical protein